jgi:RNA polymerase sigma factor (sigma-70 family)
LSYSYGSEKRSTHAYAEVPNRRSQGSGAFNKPAHSTSYGSTVHQRRTVVRSRPEGQGWEAVQEMFTASRHKFIGLAFSILRNREDAEDAVQDALLSAYLHARSFEGRSALSTWFTRIVFNAALMIRRKRKSLHTDSLPESSTTTNETPWTEKIPDPQPDPEASYAEQETLRSIDVLLSKMSPILRQAFTMTYFEEMSNEEACELLGIAAGTFKSRVFRARQHLMNKAQRVLSAPIRSRVTHSPMVTSKSEFAGMAATPAEFASQEIAFS